MEEQSMTGAATTLVPTGAISDNALFPKIFPAVKVPSNGIQEDVWA